MRHSDLPPPAMFSPLRRRADAFRDIRQHRPLFDAFSFREDIALAADTAICLSFSRAIR